MKKILIAIGSLFVLAVAILSVSAFSQNVSTNEVRRGTPPQYCHPCLFYGGDFDPTNPNANGAENSDSLGVVSTIYVPFYVPAGQKWTVTGLFSNTLSTAPYINPKQIQWSISSGVSTGNAGTLIASGTADADWIPTGRTWRSYTEYTALGHLTPRTAVNLTSGVYWMSAVPVCTAAENMCKTIYLVSNITDNPAQNGKGTEPNNHSYVTSPALNLYYAPVWLPSQCNPGACDKFSSGILGHSQPAD